MIEVYTRDAVEFCDLVSVNKVQVMQEIWFLEAPRQIDMFENLSKLKIDAAKF